MQQLTIAQLAAALIAVKQEAAAIAARKAELETQIVAAIGNAPANGEGTINASDEDAGYKVTVKYSINRSVDVAQLQLAWTGLSAAAHKAFRWKAEPDLKALRSLQEYVPAEYEAVAKFITSKPAKPSVEVEMKGAK